MNKFVYKLEKVLSIKYKMEDLAKVEFGIANRKYNDEIDKLNILYGRKINYEESLRNLFVNKINLMEIKNTQSAVKTIDNMIVEQKIEVEKSKEIMEISRKKLSDAVLERKTHEKLKEHAYEEYLKEMKITEDKEVDELISFKYGKSEKE